MHVSSFFFEGVVFSLCFFMIKEKLGIKPQLLQKGKVTFDERRRRIGILEYPFFFSPSGGREKETFFSRVLLFLFSSERENEVSANNHCAMEKRKRERDNL